MRRNPLIIASNRGPFKIEMVRGKKTWVRSPGGLVAALDPMLRERGGVWVSAGEDLCSLGKEPETNYQIAHVKLSRQIQEGFYNSVSNGLLWPLLHSFPSTVRAGAAPWAHYVSANQIFAEKIKSKIKDNKDLIWVHDFQLMLVPKLLRELGVQNRIGWFCHIPWSSPHVFSTLPWRKEVIEGLLGANVLGFQTVEYVDHFLGCVAKLTDHQVDFENKTIQVGKRKVRVASVPIGIQVEQATSIVEKLEVQKEAKNIKRLVNGRKIILGVDRLDYTKGIPERILAFEKLLKSGRSARNQYVFIQVMVPSRTAVKAYADLKDEIDRLIGDINGRFSSTGQIPIQYYYRNLSPESLYAHYLAADVALVTPLRDGMNLVAHEYVASQTEGDGVLILSEFAGAADYFSTAILVNPYSISDISEALLQALHMPEVEKKRRMKALKKIVESMNVHRWSNQFLRLLEKGNFQ